MIINDIISLVTINLPIGQLHGLIFLIIPLSIWYKQNISILNTLMIMKYIITLISCFNFELLNIISGIGNNDIREKNSFINDNYHNTFMKSVSLQLLLAIIINLFENNNTIYYLIILIAVSTWLYAIDKWSKNPTYKAVYAAYIALTLHPFIMIDFNNYNKNIIPFHIFAFSLIWLFFDITQDVKDIEIDRKENRKTVIMILFDNFGERYSILGLFILLNIIAIYINIIFDTNLLALFYIGSTSFLITSILEINNVKKIYYKYCWNFVSVIFVIWIICSPSYEIINDYYLINFESSIIISLIAIISHYCIF